MFYLSFTLFEVIHTRVEEWKRVRWQYSRFIKKEDLMFYLGVVFFVIWVILKGFFDVFSTFISIFLSLTIFYTIKQKIIEWKDGKRTLIGR